MILMSAGLTSSTLHHPADYNQSVADSARSSATEMQKYFGPLRNSDIDTFASDAFAHETHNLPRAYVGRNKFLMATIDFLITKDDDWYTRSVLPWLFTEELHVKWNIWRFNRTMMDYEPEQGVPRYVSYESESRSDSLVRRGLAFIIEHGFYKTELGRQHYLMNLKQIVEAVHETVYFGVMHELLQAPNFYEQWQRKHGNRATAMRNNDAVTALAEERWRFACVQKDIKGLFILDAEIKDRMRRVGIEPTSWIFPGKMAIYASMVPEYFNEYNRGGNPATTALEDGAKRFNTFRGCNVFETRPFDTDFMSADAVEPLVRDCEIGEFYLMDDACNEHGLQIFDMARDRFRAITFAEAHIYAVKRSSSGTRQVVHALMDGYKKDARNTYEVGDDKVYKTLSRYFNSNNAHDNAHPNVNHKSLLHYLKQALSGYNGTAKVKAMINTYNTTTRNLPGDVTKFFKALVDLLNTDGSLNMDKVDAIHDFYVSYDILLLPHKLLLFRPRMTYSMASAILLKGGEELGSTLHGHHDFQLTDDVIHKTHIGHYTFYSKSVVREPKNMYIAQDIYCTGYCGGENTEFIHGDVPGRPYAQQLREQVTHSSASLIAIAVAEDYEPDACMSILGDLSEHGPGMNGSKAPFSTSSVLREDMLGQVRLYDSTTTQGLANEEMLMNGVCFRGAEKVSADGHVWTQRQQNTGHWGPQVYDGCASVRMGQYSHLKQC